MAGFGGLLIRGAERGLEELYRYVDASDSPAWAGALLDQLLEQAEFLGELPERRVVGT